jgi:hypothetical protein
VNVPDSDPVIVVTILPDNSILAVGTDNLLYTRSTLSAPWVVAPKNGKVGNLLGIGADQQL